VEPLLLRPFYICKRFFGLFGGSIPIPMVRQFGSTQEYYVLSEKSLGRFFIG